MGKPGVRIGFILSEDGVCLTLVGELGGVALVDIDGGDCVLVRVDTQALEHLLERTHVVRYQCRQVLVLSPQPRVLVLQRAYLPR